MLNVIYEDVDVAVLNKPAGVSVHPAPHAPGELALTTEILARWPETKGVGDLSTGSGQENLRPGIVHRLDKETSGALIVAKNQRAFEHLKKQFQSQSVIKTYIALVIGKMQDREGEVRLAIRRSRKFGKFTTRGSKGTVREAVTRWKKINEYKDAGGNALTLLELKPETGRTHQIRVHLAAIGHPVAGDSLYGNKAAKVYRKALGRHFLHAVCLELTLPSGSRIRAEAELPGELKDFLNGL